MQPKAHIGDVRIPGLMTDAGFRGLGPRQEIITHLDCFLARLPRYIHQHISRYAPVDVPCRRTKILRNLV